VNPRETLTRAVELSSAAALDAARVHVFAEVLEYNDSKREVSVRPVQQERGADGVVRRLPDVHGVHLQGFEFGPFTIQGPASQGDTVLLLVSDQCVERWLADGVIADADVARPNRQLQSSIAIPVGSPQSPSATGGNLVVGLPSGAHLEITPAGAITLGGLLGSLEISALGAATLASGIGSIKLTPTGQVSIGTVAADLVGIVADTLTQLANTSAPIITSERNTYSALATLAATLRTV